MKYLLIIIALLLGGCSKMEVATNSLLLADFAQTRQIAKQPDKYIEMNKILGEHPSEGRVNGYFISCIALNTILHRVLPDTILPYYQTGLISVQVWTVSNNYTIGLNARF